MSRGKKASSLKGKLAFLGAGKMAEALIKGLLSSGISPKNIIASEIVPERRAYIEKTCGIAVIPENQKAVDFGSCLILAVKPQVAPEVFSRVKIGPEKLLISLAAGIPLSYLETKAERVVRAMPNNPALVGQGMTALAYGRNIKKKDEDTAQFIFRSVGEVVEIKESLMDAVTGLSGSGPAYVYLFIEALVEAGEKLGITKKLSEKLALKTLLGSVLTVKKSGHPVETLREMVTSPRGTTLAGLKVLEGKGFKAAVVEAVLAAAARAKELSQEWT